MSKMTLGFRLDDVVSGGPSLLCFLLSTWLLVLQFVKQSEGRLASRESGDLSPSELVVCITDGNVIPCRRDGRMWRAAGAGRDLVVKHR
ncbi:hypothetical protein QBC40DRAFT_1312 [Triangularia verruculosa]|uniref:Uncharacterized protein n=1 Tax=Triangularia verruculosa TaxID=2587418 RepID=A0AAN7AY43_9PEZI|nr:hypothetical protein QBC40DRAFT_1312 [Triangularia verruculosa]